MARAKTKAARARAQMARAMDPERNTQSPEQTPMLILSGWAGADHSERRGFISWHSAGDTRRELPPIADKEIRRRSHWLYQNTGIARRIIRGAAQLVGWVTPQPATDNPEWNRLAFENFMATAGSPNVFDARGQLDFFTAQFAVNVTRWKDGRVLGALTESPGGMARMAFYEAHQIHGQDSTNGWEQGCLLDKFDRHLAYSVSDPKKPGESRIIQARDSIYFGNWDAMGRIHGLPMLAHAVAPLLDMVEIDAATKHAIKINSEIGIAIETDSGPGIQLPTGGIMGLGGVREIPVQETRTGENGEQITETVIKKVSWENVMAQGGIPALPKGQKVKIVYDDRPGPNREAFHQRIVEQAIMGGDLPPAAVYYLSDLKGPGVRYTMEQIQRFVEIRHRKMAQEAQRFYVYHIAKEVKAGRLPAPPPNWWNKVIWIGMADPTIDSGRDGNTTVTMLESGLTTWAKEWKGSGEFWQKNISDRIREVAFAKAECLKASEEFGVDVSLSEAIPRLKAA